MNQSFPPTVCLNGTAVRNIREEKKLTQLYVAKVVGVTTDTISRWENNRYPSIKRENAQRLAEALEVPVEALLQEVCEEEPASEEIPLRRRPLRLHITIFLTITLLVGGYLLLQRQKLPPIHIEAKRTLFPYAAPGTVIPIEVRLGSDTDTGGFILKEHFPPGWKLIEASPPASSLDNEAGTARWIIKPGDKRRLVAYLVRVAPTAVMGIGGDFSGEVIAQASGRQRPVTVAGPSEVRVAPFHWADRNGDGVIDDGEVLQAYDTIEEMKGVHLDWDTIESIWDAGGYRLDGKHHCFAPAKPSPKPAENPAVSLPSASREKTTAP